VGRCGGVPDSSSSPVRCGGDEGSDRRAPPVSARAREKGGAGARGWWAEGKNGRAALVGRVRGGKERRGEGEREREGCGRLRRGKKKEREGEGSGPGGLGPRGRKRGKNFICYPNANDFEFEV
jgi:hypothetical protein